jgi:aminoglycoside phosphotransferase (APT) family kinase protein
VPVAPAIGLCTDESVNGSPFYVMGFVEGHILRDAATVEKVLDEDARRAAGQSLVDVLAEIHAVDVDSVGLGDLGRREGYIARQLKRWYSQFQQSNATTERRVPLVDDLHDFLAARIPDQGPATIVHGDYRLDNTMLGDDGMVRAVLDWEICTLGDPLADLGYVLATWTQSTDPVAGTPGAPSLAPGFPNRDEVLERYAKRSGRDLAKIDFYVAFSMWKSACIIEGVYARYLGGALGKTDVDLDQFKTRIESFAELAEQAVARFA